MDYQQTLDYLYSQLPMFTRIGSAAYKEDLHNTLALCSAIGNPQEKFKSIHVAGTNGKGSTSHMLAAILQSAGYKTGLYTSPHIHEFGERIRINGEMIDKQFVIDFVKRIKPLLTEIEPSFFELTVAMAFECFAGEKVDIAIIETGLGGRLDSTNIISPILSVITNIGLDHVAILGDTLAKIAYEKAGIIKRNTAVIVGEYLPETIDIFKQKAAAMGAPLHFAEEEYAVSNIRLSNDGLSCRITDIAMGCSEDFQLDLAGAYQAKNLRTVIAAEAVLISLGFTIPGKAEKYGYANVKKLTGLSGRWDIIGHSPMVIQDVAHNEAGIKEVLQQLENNFPDAKIHFILGFVKDKDVEHVLAMFPRSAAYYFTNAHIPRALPAKALKDLAATAGLEGEEFDDVNLALKSARLAAGLNDVIMICGSFFIIGELIP